MNENFDPHKLEEPHREMEYADDFKKFIADNPGALKSFLTLEKEIGERRKEGKLKFDDVFDDGDLRISFIIKDSSYLPNLGKYFKVEINGQAFFVKKTPAHYLHPDSTHGIAERRSLEKAKELLKDLENVEMVDFQLGYKDQNGKTYFVSKFLDLPTLAETYRQLSKSKKGLEKKEKLKARVEKIEEIFRYNHFIDFHVSNILYDEKTEKFYLFDAISLKK